MTKNRENLEKKWGKCNGNRKEKDSRRRREGREREKRW